LGRGNHGCNRPKLGRAGPPLQRDPRTLSVPSFASRANQHFLVSTSMVAPLKLTAVALAGDGHWTQRISARLPRATVTAPSDRRQPQSFKIAETPPHSPQRGASVCHARLRAFIDRSPGGGVARWLVVRSTSTSIPRKRLFRPAGRARSQLLARLTGTF
jgi:hypothetical protein